MESEAGKGYGRLVGVINDFVWGNPQNFASWKLTLHSLYQTSKTHIIQGVHDYASIWLAYRSLSSMRRLVTINVTRQTVPKRRFALWLWKVWFVSHFLSQGLPWTFKRLQ